MDGSISRRQLAGTMKGELSHEYEAAVPAAKVWGVYGTLQLPRLIPQLLPDMIEKVEIHGDGGAGTILTNFSAPGSPGPKRIIEVFVKVDNEKRVKETIQMNETFLYYITRFEIIDKGSHACVIKSTIEYETREGSDADASLVTTDIVAAVAEGVVKFLSC